jgi:hypothetical protein
MNDLEKGLRAALEREPAPLGFRDRVLARIDRKRVSGWRTPWVRWSIAAALVTAFAVTATMEYREQERLRGERARNEVLLALRITGSTLRAVQTRIIRADREQGERR